jgi:hypothetical protein
VALEPYIEYLEEQNVQSLISIAMIIMCNCPANIKFESPAFFVKSMKSTIQYIRVHLDLSEEIPGEWRELRKEKLQNELKLTDEDELGKKKLAKKI